MIRQGKKSILLIILMIATLMQVAVAQAQPELKQKARMITLVAPRDTVVKEHLKADDAPVLINDSNKTPWYCADHQRLDKGSMEEVFFNINADTKEWVSAYQSFRKGKENLLDRLSDTSIQFYKLKTKKPALFWSMYGLNFKVFLPVLLNPEQGRNDGKIIRECYSNAELAINKNEMLRWSNLIRTFMRKIYNNQDIVLNQAAVDKLFVKLKGGHTLSFEASRAKDSEKEIDSQTHKDNSGGDLPPPPPPPPPPPVNHGDNIKGNEYGTSQHQVKIFAAKGWQKTGCKLSSGDSIKIFSSGMVQYTSRVTAPGNGKATPSGVPVNGPPIDGTSNDFREYSINPLWNHCALIARVGKQLELVGTGTQFVASQSDELEMRLNDKDIGNNIGAFDVNIFSNCSDNRNVPSKRKANKQTALESQLKQVSAAEDEWYDLRNKWKRLSDYIDEQRVAGKDVSALMRNLRPITNQVQKARASYLELKNKHGTPDELRKKINVLSPAQSPSISSEPIEQSYPPSPDIYIPGIPKASDFGFSGKSKAAKPVKGGGNPVNRLPGNSAVSKHAQLAHSKQMITPVRWIVYKVKTVSRGADGLPNINVIKIAFKKSTSRAALIVKSYSVSLLRTAAGTVLWSINWNNGDIEERKMTSTSDEMLMLERNAEQRKSGSVTKNELDIIIGNTLGSKAKKKN